MNAETAASRSLQPKASPPTAIEPIVLKPVKIGLRTRFIIWLMRVFLRPWLARIIRGSEDRMARVQLWLAGRECKDSSGLPLEYCVLGKAPGHLLGRASDTHKPVVLYLHGGAFV